MKQVVLTIVGLVLAGTGCGALGTDVVRSEDGIDFTTITTPDGDEVRCAMFDMFGNDTVLDCDWEGVTLRP